MIFKYSESAAATPDAYIERLVEDIFSGGCNQYPFNQEIFVNAVRLYMIKNNIPYTDVEFHIGDSIVTLTSNYQLSQWPEELNYNEKIIDSLLDSKKENLHSEQYNKIRSEVEKWTDYKKQSYNDNFATSAHVKKFTIGDKKNIKIKPLTEHQLK